MTGFDEKKIKLMFYFGRRWGNSNSILKSKDTFQGYLKRIFCSISLTQLVMQSQEVTSTKTIPEKNLKLGEISFLIDMVLNYLIKQQISAMCSRIYLIQY